MICILHLLLRKFAWHWRSFHFPKNVILIQTQKSPCNSATNILNGSLIMYTVKKSENDEHINLTEKCTIFFFFNKDLSFFLARVTKFKKCGKRNRGAQWTYLHMSVRQFASHWIRFHFPKILILIKKKQKKIKMGVSSYKVIDFFQITTLQPHHIIWLNLKMYYTQPI